MNILAMDPGETTGFARWNGEFYSWETPGGLSGSYDVLHHELWEGDHFVYEKFVILPSTTKKNLDSAYTALYLIGAALVWCETAKIARIKSYLPADKSFATDAHLKALGWYKTGLGGHANDAARHLLKYMCDYRLLPDHLWSVLIDLELSA